MRLFVSAVAAASVMTLSSCNSISGFTDPQPNEGPCPAAGSLYEAQRVIFFNGEGENFTNIEFTGEITGVNLYCRYVDDNPITAQMDIDFAFGRGEASSARDKQYQFFVAVTRTNRAVIDKQVFPIDVRFPRDENIVSIRETIDRIEIPRADSSISGANFEILVGFELTDEQRKFNEDGRRFLLQTD